MTILKENTKVIRGLSGEVLDNTAGNSNLILHIDTDLQLPNRIFKDGSNLVSQVTDKAQNIPFVSPSGNEPTYVYGNGFKSTNLQYFTFKDNYDTLDTWYCHMDFYVNVNPVANDKYKVIINRQVSSNDRIQFGFYKTGGVTKLYVLIGTQNITYDFNPTLNQRYSLGFYRGYNTGQAAYFAGIILDGVLVAAAAASTSSTQPTRTDFFANPDAPTFCDDGTITVNNFCFYKTALEDYEPVEMVDLIAAKVNNTFTYYQRYKNDGNKKLYLSSKYLKDAVINSSDVIERVNSSIGTKHIFNNDVAKRGIFDRGFKYLEAQKLYHDILDLESDFNFLNSDFLVSGWLKLLSTPNSYQIIIGQGTSSTDRAFSFAYLNSSGKLQLSISQNGTTWNTYVFNNTITVNNWTYFGLQRLGANLYLYMNGVLDAIHSIGGGYTIYSNSNRLRLGKYGNDNNSMDGIIDDLLIEKNTLTINPTGYSVGDKVFEPPRRGGFDDTITEF